MGRNWGVVMTRLGPCLVFGGVAAAVGGFCRLPSVSRISGGSPMWWEEHAYASAAMRRVEAVVTVTHIDDALHKVVRLARVDEGGVFFQVNRK